MIGCFIGAVALAALFAFRSGRHRAPVLELGIVRVPAFALASLSAALFYAAFSAMLLGNVLFLTGVWHYSVLRAGLALTPGPVAAAVFAPFAGRLAQRIGPGLVGGAGAALFGTGSRPVGRAHRAGPGLPGPVLPRHAHWRQRRGPGPAGLHDRRYRHLAAATLATGIGAQTMFRQIGATLGVAAFVAILGTPSPGSVIGAYNDTRWFMIASAAAAALALALIRHKRLTER